MKTWIPVVKPFPIGTLPIRWKVKWQRHSLRRFISKLLKIDRSITEFVRLEENGNSILRLRRNGVIGHRRDLIQIPEDEIIFENIKTCGYWEIEESIFLATALSKIARGKNRARGTLIDIGANAGWVTIQALALTRSRSRVIMVEPIRRHVEAIEFNIALLRKSFSITVAPYALSDRNGTAEIHSEQSNQGNTSLISSVVPKGKGFVTNVNLKSTSEFVNEYLSDSDPLVIKCDIQGHDSVVLSQFPSGVWSRTRAAVVEIWAIEEVNAIDVQLCMKHWKVFKSVSWNSTGKTQISLDEVSEFWLGRSGEVRNLFLVA